MADFNDFILTKLGKSIMAGGIASLFSLDITKVAFSDQSYSGSLEDLTQLTHEVTSTGTFSRTQTGTNEVTIRAELEEPPPGGDYKVWQIGIFARARSGQEGLFAVTQAVASPESVISGAGLIYVYEIKITHHTANSVSVTLDSSGFLTKADIEAYLIANTAPIIHQHEPKDIVDWQDNIAAYQHEHVMADITDLNRRVYPGSLEKRDDKYYLNPDAGVTIDESIFKIIANIKTSLPPGAQVIANNNGPYPVMLDAQTPISENIVSYDGLIQNRMTFIVDVGVGRVFIEGYKKESITELYRGYGGQAQRVGLYDYTLETQINKDPTEDGSLNVFAVSDTNKDQTKYSVNGGAFEKPTYNSPHLLSLRGGPSIGGYYATLLQGSLSGVERWTESGALVGPFTNYTAEWSRYGNFFISHTTAKNNRRIPLSPLDSEYGSWNLRFYIPESMNQLVTVDWFIIREGKYIYPQQNSYFSLNGQVRLKKKDRLLEVPIKYDPTDEPLKPLPMEVGMAEFHCIICGLL